MYTTTASNQTSNEFLSFNYQLVGNLDESMQKSKLNGIPIKRKLLKCKNSSRTMTQTYKPMQAISILLLVFCATVYVEAGGKGEKGSEGNIIISTGGGGGGHSEKIKIMKIPVPFPVIKHVPYPVPVPIIQKKYIPVEKYIPVYKHHGHHHGSSHEGGYGGEESQQHDQYGSSAASSNSEQDNTASNQASSDQSNYSSGPFSTTYKSSARMSGNHYWPPQMFGQQQSMGAEGQLNPYALQMASSNGPDMNNLFSGSSGYSMGYGNGNSEFGQLYNSLSAGSGYGFGQASNPAYQTAYGYGGPSIYGAGQMGDSSFQQQYAASTQNDYSPAYPGATGYGSGVDSELPAYQQAMSLQQPTHMSAGLSSTSLTTASSPGSSAPVPRHAPKSLSSAPTQSNHSAKQTASTTSPLSSTSAQTPSSRPNRAFMSPQSSNTISTKYSKSLSPSSTTQLNGFKPTSGSGKLLASPSSLSSQTNEMMAVSSTPQAYHQSLIGPPKNLAQLDSSNSRQKPNVVQLPIVHPNMVSVISQQPSQQQQQQQGGTKAIPQQATQQQSTFPSSLLSPTQVGDQILQRIRKFTNHLTNSTKTLQQQVGVATVKL